MERHRRQFLKVMATRGLGIFGIPAFSIGSDDQPSNGPADPKIYRPNKAICEIEEELISL